MPWLPRYALNALFVSCNRYIIYIYIYISVTRGEGSISDIYLSLTRYKQIYYIYIAPSLPPLPSPLDPRGGGVNIYIEDTLYLFYALFSTS